MRANAIALLTVAILTACAKTDRSEGDSVSAMTSAAAPMAMGETGGMNTPESVRYDSSMDVYFVSNIAGNPSVKDSNGFIAVIKADSTNVVRRLVESGRAAGGGKPIVLNAPKGIAIKGDTLWVADISTVHAINKHTGASIAEIPIIGATFLNDVAIGPDGAVYVTDTGIMFDAKGNITHPGINRIFKISGRTVSTVAEGDSLNNPNGITWDAANKRWLLAPFGGNDVQTLAFGAKNPAKLASGPGQFDGIEVLPDGRILVSSWTDSSVHVISNGAMTKYVTGVSAPADIGIDSKRMTLAIPRFNDGKISYYMIH